MLTSSAAAGAWARWGPFTFATFGTGLLIAQAAPSWWDDVRAWGPGGVAFGLLLFGVIVPKYVVDRAYKDLTDVRAQRDALVAQQAEVIPVLVQVKDATIPALERNSRSMETLTRELTDLRAEVRRLTDRGTGG
jgi:hypothetical protein